MLFRSLKNSVQSNQGLESLDAALLEYLRVFNPSNELLNGLEKMIKWRLDESHKKNALTTTSQSYALLAWAYDHSAKINVTASEKPGLLMPFYWLLEAASTHKAHTHNDTFLPQTVGFLLSAMSAFEAAHPELDTEEKKIGRAHV